MKKLLFILPFVFFLFLSSTSHADKVTHTLGTTGYMIQDAMWAKAYKYDKENYFLAVKLQYEAKRYLRGTHKKGRSVTKAVELSKQAYELAKKARDISLAQQGLEVSH